ncbi:tRNA modification GTPase [Bacteroidota bacterium]
MKKIATFVLILIFAVKGYSQSTFVKGYYIDNSNNKIEGFIKNYDWLNNPTEIKFKLYENSEEKILTVESVKEFTLLNISKYIRYNGNMDRSTNNLDELDYSRQPIFKKEKLFLKVVLEGKANLYSYEDEGLNRYFFSKEKSEIAPLICKSYLTENNQLTHNNEFRQQLLNSLKCESISTNQLKQLKYRQSELLRLFIKYNECHKVAFVNFLKKQKKNLFNLTLRPGIRSSSLIVSNEQVPWKKIDFGKGLKSFRLGLEAEFIFGFNNNKWSLILEPTYQKFESKAETIINQRTKEKAYGSVNHESIDISFGIKHYMFLNEDVKLFASGSGVFGTSSNSLIKITTDNSSTPFLLDINPGINLAIGIGCKYKERYNLELRYLPKRNILNSLGAWGTDFTSVSLILGYSIF